MCTVVYPMATLGESFDDYLANRVAKDHRRALKKAQQMGLEFKPASLDHLREFYDTLLVPYARARHTERAHLPTWEDIEHVREHLSLHLLHEDGKPIAGYLLLQSRRHNSAELWRMGIDETLLADKKKLRAVGAAMDADALQQTMAQGLEKFSLGPTAPVLNAGELVNKRRWGCSLHTPEHYPRCQVAFTSARKFELLNHRPLVCVRAEEPYGLTAASQPAHLGAVQHTIKTGSGEKMGKFTVLHPVDYRPDIQHLGKGKIELRKVS